MSKQTRDKTEFDDMSADELTELLEAKRETISEIENALATTLRDDVNEMLVKVAKLSRAQQDLIWSGPPINETLSKVGLRWTPFADNGTSKGKSGAKRTRRSFPPEEVTAFIGAPGAVKSNSEIMAHFDWQSQMASRKLGSMEKDGLLEKINDNGNLRWKVVKHKKEDF